MIKYNFYPKKQEFYPYEEEWYLTYCDTSEETESELELTLPTYLNLGSEENPDYRSYNIYNAAFWGEDKIKILKTPMALTSIGAYAFYRSSIEEFYLYSNVQEINSAAFEGIENEFIVYVPSGWRNRFATQAWYNALGGKSKWETRLKEGDYSVSEGKTVLPLYRAGQIVNEIELSAEAEKMGLMPWYATKGTVDGTFTEINIGAKNKHFPCTEDGIITSVINGKHLYRSNENSNLSEAKVGEPLAQDDKGKRTSTLFESWKTNSLYKNDDKTLYLNTKRVENLAVQDATNITTITLDPEVDYIYPFAFKGFKNKK